MYQQHSETISTICAKVAVAQLVILSVFRHKNDSIDAFCTSTFGVVEGHGSSIPCSGHILIAIGQFN